MTKPWDDRRQGFPTGDEDRLPAPRVRRLNPPGGKPTGVIILFRGFVIWDENDEPTVPPGEIDKRMSRAINGLDPEPSPEEYAAEAARDAAEAKRAADERAEREKAESQMCRLVQPALWRDDD